MRAVHVLGKGQIVIPAELRRKYRLRQGSELKIIEYGGLLYLVPPVTDPVGAAKSCLPDIPSLTEELVKERSRDR